MSASGHKKKDREDEEAGTTEKNKQQHRQQAYRSDWEKDSNFTGWLQPVVGVTSKAFGAVATCKWWQRSPF